MQLHPDADLAIVEAGISQKGEMEILAELIRPTIGVLTHMGSAHAEGFEDEDQKLKEKLLLFGDVESLLMGSGQKEILQKVRAAGLRPIHDWKRGK